MQIKVLLKIYFVDLKYLEHIEENHPCQVGVCFRLLCNLGI